MKKALSIMLAIILMVAIIPMGILSVSASNADFLGYSLVNGSEYQVISCDNSISGALVIPSTYQGKKVTSIGVAAFYDCGELTSVVIPDTVKEIGNEAFKYCGKLRSVTVPDTVTKIGKKSFWECTSLEKIYIPNGVRTIEEYAFAYCNKLTDVAVGSGVTKIEEYAFFDCTGLKEIVIPGSVTILEDGAFLTEDSCNTSVKITLPETITEITMEDGVEDDSLFLGRDFSAITIYGITGSFIEEYATEKDITFVAIGESGKATVRFIDYDGEQLSEQIISIGQNAVAPADPERAGYIFAGWDREFKNVRTNYLFVYAKYIDENDACTVTFKDWNGSVIKTQKIISGNSATVPMATRTGYKCTGWKDQNGNWVSDFSGITRDITVTAQYEIIKYTVAKVDGKGKTSETVNYGSKINLGTGRKTFFKRAVGWDSSNGPFAENNATVTITSDVTYTAEYVNVFTYFFQYVLGW